MYMLILRKRKPGRRLQGIWIHFWEYFR